MTDLDLDALRRLAEATTRPGEWFAQPDGTVTRHNPTQMAEAVALAYPMGGSPRQRATAEFIATFDPPTVLALLDRLAVAEERAAVAAAELEHVDGLNQMMVRHAEEWKRRALAAEGAS